MFWKKIVKAQNIVLLLSMISPAARELGMEKRHWKNDEDDFLDFRWKSSAMLTQ